MCGARAAAPSSCRAPQLPISFAAPSKTIACCRSSPADRALVLPQILTRSGWYDAMHARLPSPPRRLTDLEREVLLNAAARDAAASEAEPPFRLRAGLLVEMLALYDDLRRRDSSVDNFERVIARELERDAEDDRGAARLLKQTRFLAAAFRRYEARRDATGAVDEYALWTKLLEVAPSAPATSHRRDRRRALGRLGWAVAGGSRPSHAAAPPRADRYRRHARDDRCRSAGSSREVHARLRGR